jgi:hypothetical protein
MRDLTGNLPTLPGVFPDYSAPIVRTAVDGVRELTMTRWGMPSPIFALKDRKSDPGVTNVRNVGSPHWRRWLGAESRRVVPFTSFAEHEVLPDGSRPPVWFALDEGRPLAFFAGFWTLDVSAQGEGRRNDKRPLRFPDDGAQRRRRANPPQGHAGHFDEARRNRGLAFGADCGGLEAATAAARRRASDRRAGVERGWTACGLVCPALTSRVDRQPAFRRGAFAGFIQRLEPRLVERAKECREALLAGERDNDPN